MDKKFRYRSNQNSLSAQWLDTLHVTTVLVQTEMFPRNADGLYSSLNIYSQHILCRKFFLQYTFLSEDSVLDSTNDVTSSVYGSTFSSVLSFNF